MSKRPSEQEQNEEYKIRKKIKRYERKLARCAQLNQASKMAASSEPPPPPLEQQAEAAEDMLLLSQSQPEYDEHIAEQEHPHHVEYEMEALNQGMLPEQHDYDNVLHSQIPEAASTISSDSSSSSEPAELPVDPKLLEALGDCQTDTPKWGDDILENIAQRWEPIFKTGLKKEIKEDLFKKYLFPKNMASSKPPVLNAEIAAVLTESSKNRDARVSSKQNQIGRAITALGRAMTGIINNSMEMSDVIRILSDAGRLLSDSHYLETDTRRSLVTPLLDKTYITPFKDRKRDNFLFGENLGDFIKSYRGIKKTGQMITPPAPSTSNLNFKVAQRQQRNVRVQQTSCGGGPQRAPPPPVRRSAPPPPPPMHAPRSNAPRLPAHNFGNQRTQTAPSRTRS